MAIDLSRVASKALETALEDGQPHKRGGSTVRAMAAGAALAVGARAVVSKKPGKLSLLGHLPDLAALRDIPDRLRDRMADAGWLDDEPDVDDELEPEAEFAEDEPQDDEELEDEDDDELDEEDEELDDDDDEDEPEAEADEDFDEDEEEFEDDEDDESEPPELEIESEDDEDLHPEDRPPKPPRSKAKTGR